MSDPESSSDSLKRFFAISSFSYFKIKASGGLIPSGSPSGKILSLSIHILNSWRRQTTMAIWARNSETVVVMAHMTKHRISLKFSG